ncbi:hypothetical protein [Nocardia sp. NPDC058705]|uniref:hypothetical protein n=1 Tax=Nocardia sp. NPDC058705 TaxID=3346609 RepID=UPI003687D32E
MFATRSLSLTAAVAGCAVAAAVAAPTASASWPPHGPMNSYFLGDALNCYVDVRLSVEADPTDGRPVAFVEPVGIRSTIPGLAAPATCSATLGVTWTDERNKWTVLPSGVQRVDAGPGTAERSRLDLNLPPETRGTMVNWVPQSAILVQAAAYPVGWTAVGYGDMS